MTTKKELNAAKKNQNLPTAGLLRIGLIKPKVTQREKSNPLNMAGFREERKKKLYLYDTTQNCFS